MIELKGKKWYTAKDVAEKYGVCENTVSRWRRDGFLKCWKVSSRKFYFSEEHMDRVFENMHKKSKCKKTNKRTDYENLYVTLTMNDHRIKVVLTMKSKKEGSPFFNYHDFEIIADSREEAYNSTVEKMYDFTKRAPCSTSLQKLERQLDDIKLIKKENQNEQY